MAALKKRWQGASLLVATVYGNFDSCRDLRYDDTFTKLMVSNREEKEIGKFHTPGVGCVVLVVVLCCYSLRCERGALERLRQRTSRRRLCDDGPFMFGFKLCFNVLTK